ncbi:endonuclease/exonuclease/phosphatase family protein [Celeribacter litoreus]|uniref:endonuclease/exonuclease/phosphatase family protein n=1 Tax=Celeribacter litoreus TaxID=2876714 RepID=UPI001CC8F0B8|nr:endonuclease/exonuclease/phosphatase family protein [Celeribacter litoreus]MCA0044735.1 endonuclease/exonuclease/phosphatase family protein [Celeribacter litoreus]
MIPRVESGAQRFASYNLRKCKGTDGHRAPGRVLDVINSLEADVVALQEADMRLGPRPAALPPRLIETHTDFIALPVNASPVSVGWHGNAILVRKSAQVDAVHQFDLPGLEPRGAVAADLPGVRVVGVHLGLLRASRQKQLHAIRAHLSKLDDRPTIIMGDFNEWSRHGGLDPLRDAFSIFAPGRSFHASRPIAALDRIATTKEIEMRDSGVMETALSQRASDHLPVWADLILHQSA